MRFGLKHFALAAATFIAAQAVDAQNVKLKDLNKSLRKNPTEHYTADSSAYELLGGRGEAWFSAEYVKKDDGKVHLVQTVSRSFENQGFQYGIREMCDYVDANGDKHHSPDEMVSKMLIEEIGYKPSVEMTVRTQEWKQANILVTTRAADSLFKTEPYIQDHKEGPWRPMELAQQEKDVLARDNNAFHYKKIRNLMLARSVIVFDEYRKSAAKNSRWTSMGLYDIRGYLRF